MKFTISTLTAMHICSAIDEINHLNEVETMPASERLLNAANEANELENFSVTFTPGTVYAETVVEINDEIVIRFISLYMKTARLVAPAIKTVVGMFSLISKLIQGDCDDLVSFINQRK